jgi:transcriptional regulator with XRE-family HTH domain
MLEAIASHRRDHSTESPGLRLKKVREQLGLTYRDVEQASLTIAARHQNDEFSIALSRLADIENKGTVPTLYRLYALCVIYRLNLHQVLRWYGIDLNHLAEDVTSVEVPHSHPVDLTISDLDSLEVPLALDPGVDLKKTTFLSRWIRRWGPLSVALLNSLDMKNHRYAFIGTEDWTMHPLLQPGSLVLIDETKRKVVTAGWTNEFERPIYFMEHRSGYECSWCGLEDGQLIVQPHPASHVAPRSYQYPDEIDILGQVTGVAMRLGLGRRRRTRS